MAVNGTHNVGEEWKQKNIYRQDTIGTRNSEVEVGLYNDNTDSLTESSDIGDISSEPDEGNYSRQTIPLDATDFSLSIDGSGDLRVEGSATFDLLDTGETVDGYFITVDFQSDIVNSEGSANEHTVISATFGTEDLSEYSEITITLQDTMS